MQNLNPKKTYFYDRMRIGTMLIKMKFISYLLVFLFYASRADHSQNTQVGSLWRKNGSFDVFECCSVVFGSCRTSCENLSLLELTTTNQNNGEYRLGDIRRNCPIEQADFWECINKTLQAVTKGSQWMGRMCCSLAISPRCRNICATSGSKNELNPGCRQSDEQHIFSCLETQEIGDDCCGKARTADCLQACRDTFEHRSSTATLKHNRKELEQVCGGNNSNSKVLQCVKSHIDVTPIVNSQQYLPCCDYSQNEDCRNACKHILKKDDTTHATIDELEKGGCGSPLPYDPLWQCFFSAGKKVIVPANTAEVSQINQIGMDSAKLHCCHKAVAPKCRRLCLKTFSNDWTSTRGDFDVDCLMQVNELHLRQCIDEVDEPCELGCDGLSFCTNFNNRPTELFRSCHIHADLAAHADVSQWQKSGYLALSGLNLPIKNISKCSPYTWRAVACTLQIKPCTRKSHTNQICQEDCYEILSKCLDWTKLGTLTGATAASLCSKLSPDEQEIPCISLKPYLEPSDIPSNTGGHHKLTSPCKGHSCNTTEVCRVNRNGKTGYHCVPGCELGEASSYMVPLNAYVRIPVSPYEKGCMKICRCGWSGKVENCQPLPCFSFDACNLGSRRIEHATWFYLECNICSCFAGEIMCTKRQCRIPGLSHNSYSSLPCNCPSHYVPVCGKNGITYPSLCVAKCTGLQDADFEIGACKSRNPCTPGAHSCSLNTKCVEYRQVCLTSLHKPCLQYQCVNITSNCSTDHPACDVKGKTHPSACHLFASGSDFLHFGSCFESCDKHNVVCGINGVTYNNECEAWSDFSLVDYQGKCREIGLLSSEMGPRCKSIECVELPSSYCQGIVPPGACCPICSGAFRVVFSRKQIDRPLYALKGKNMEILSLKSILYALDSLIRISECQLSGYITIETDLFVAVQSREKEPSPVQIEACMREAEKIVDLISMQSHRITSSLPLSALTVANMVKPPTLAADQSDGIVLCCNDATICNICLNYILIAQIGVTLLTVYRTRRK